jgi:DUF1680 family protein
MKNGVILIILFSIIACNQSQETATDSPDNTALIEPVLKPLTFGSVQPTGWLKDEMQRNLNGFTGHLDSLAPDLILNDDIYGKNRLSKQVKNKNVGALSDAGEWQAQFLWWNSETQSNWLDGLVRSAILAKDTKMIAKAGTIIRRMLSTQDADGYLGIYDKDLRYQFDDENGELWSKATLYRALLAWYEYAKDKKVLDAIVIATDNVMQHYPVNASHPFYSKNPNAGGLTHGLVFTDVLERLYFLTGQKKYLDYCVFLYKDFSAQTLNEDAQSKKLVDTTLALMGHGVHTYEHLRPLAAAYYASGNDAYKTALTFFLKKIDATTTPSGGLAGDEFIGGRKGDAQETGYEFCSLHEGMAGWISMLEKTGETVYAAKAEKILFNAAMGATHPTESAICYLKTDNAFILTGGKHGDTTDKHQTRYRYSPVHKEAAVCCVPNAGRILPYYVQSMWMKDTDGLVATLLGPCEVSAELDNRSVRIREETNYPFEDNIRFDIQTDVEGEFTIKVIKPVWAKEIKASIPYEEQNGYLVFRRFWKTNDSFEVTYEKVKEEQMAGNGDIYYDYGPLVLCRELNGIQKVTKNYGVYRLQESIYHPLDTVAMIYTGGSCSLLTLIPNKKVDTQIPFLFMTGMLNPWTGKGEEVVLVPMFHTILRQVTFKTK